MTAIVGVIGAGQLARMLALAGWPLGLRFRFLDPAEDACAFGLGEAIHSSFDDNHALARLADGADVVTYEFENIGFEGIAHLSRSVRVHPDPKALFVKQDRLREKQLFEELDIPTAPFQSVRSSDDLRQAAGLGWPLVVKTRSHGYDGKGQWVLEDEKALHAFGGRWPGRPCLVESFVRYDREVSIIGVRDGAGKTVFYPLSENFHSDGILRASRSRPDDPVAACARDYTLRLLEHFDYRGVLAVEFFQVGERLLANEFAPRVHNTGHWTIEGAETSQFENHLRAVLGLPLGSTKTVGSVLMLNLIGRPPDVRRMLEVPGVHVHLYGKAVRPKRKVGHITLRAFDERELARGFKRLRDALKGGGLADDVLDAVERWFDFTGRFVGRS